jgi:hypothetical protein
MIRIPDCQPMDERFVLRAPASWRCPLSARLQLLA